VTKAFDEWSNVRAFYGFGDRDRRISPEPCAYPHYGLTNWFLARGQFAATPTEGFGNNARVATRKAYATRTYSHLDRDVCRALGSFLEPPYLTHMFC